MTVTVVSVTMLAALLATPLICTGLVMQWLPPQYCTARLTGMAMVVSGWVLWGVGEAAAHVWWVVAVDAALALTGLCRVRRICGAFRREQQ